MSETVRIADRMDRLPITGRHIALLIFIFIGWFSENIDLGGTSFLLPTIREAFKMTPEVGGYYSSVCFVGMLIGAVVAGPLADRVGRKKVIVVSMISWGVIGALMAFAPTVEILFGLRFVLGIGLGAQFPVAMSLLSESVPSKHRARCMTLFQMFAPVGVATAGLITVLVLPHFNWQGVYLAEAVPAVFVIGIILCVPESALWLERVGRTAEAEKVCAFWEAAGRRKLGGELPEAVAFVPPAGAKETASIKDLFSRKYIGLVVLCFFIWGFSMFSDYGLTTWLTTLLTEKGFDVIKSTGFVAIGICGGIPAFFFTSWAANKFGRKKTFLIGGILTCVFAIIYGASSTMITLVAFGIMYQFGKYVNAMNLALYTPELYDTHIRGAGTGLATSFGRLGSIFGPIFLAVVFATFGADFTFYFAAAFAVVPGLCVFFFGPETKGKRF